MKKGTMFELIIDDDGMWTATSPTYPGWVMSGVGQPSVDILFNDLRAWSEEDYERKTPGDDRTPFEEGAARFKKHEDGRI